MGGDGAHYREIECLWDLETRPEIPISLTIGNVSLLADDCGEHSIAVAREDGDIFHTECGQTRGKTKVVAVQPPDHLFKWFSRWQHSTWEVFKYPGNTLEKSHSYQIKGIWA